MEFKESPLGLLLPDTISVGLLLDGDGTSLTNSERCTNRSPLHPLGVPL